MFVALGAMIIWNVKDYGLEEDDLRIELTDYVMRVCKIIVDIYMSITFIEVFLFFLRRKHF